MCAGLSFGGNFVGGWEEGFGGLNRDLNFSRVVATCRWLFKILNEPKAYLCYAKTF